MKIHSTLILMLLFLCNSCNTDSISGLKIKNDFCELEIIDDSYVLKTFTDNKNEFSIDFPDYWIPYEDLIDATHGVSASDTLDNFAKLGIIGVTKNISSYNNLYDNFKAEIETYKADSNFIIYEIGKTKINSYLSYWTIYEAKGDEFGINKSILYYIQKGNTNIFYLLEIAVYENDNYKQRFCELRPIIETFKLK